MLIELIALPAAFALQSAQVPPRQIPQTRVERTVRQTPSERLIEAQNRRENPERQALLDARAELDADYAARRIDAATYAEANMRNAIALLLLEDSLRNIGADDKLGNFEIQNLMSTYNQSQQTASSVTKKIDDTSAAVIGKIG